MLKYQKEQGNERDISVFEKSKFSPFDEGGFDWDKTKEKFSFWYNVIGNKDFNLFFFFEKYPKKDNQDNSQEFKVGDNVIDIITGRIGKVTENLIIYDENLIAINDVTYEFTEDDDVCKKCEIPEDYCGDVNCIPSQRKDKKDGYFKIIKKSINKTC